ncbi:MAG: hypothetical protein IJS12_04120 [Lachnospiraceae bacterium]|nr:hypothetical protein [Butyrivibrio sp.]MBQ9333501.1 hypothetical protein [Lachnospiraceae bacterium]
MTKAIYTGSAYHMAGGNIVKNKVLHFKFDTSATSTFVTLGALNKDIKQTEEEIQRVFKRCRDNGVIANNYISASGQEMFAVKCYAENVTMGKIFLPRFYYWLSPMVDNRKLLLGDDFIRFCDFKHAPESDIIIEDFKVDDYISFNSKINPTDCISQNEILDMIANEQ